jgi:hypothetical protein
MLPLCVGLVTGGVVTVPEPVPGGGLVGIVTLELPIGVGTFEVVEDTVGKRVNPGVVVSVPLAIGAEVGERMALVRSEMMGTKPPDDEGVGAAEDAAEDTAEVTAEDASVALALGAGVGVGAMALVISEMIGARMPDEEPVGAAEEMAGDALVVLAVGAGAIALVISEMIPPNRPDEEATGAAEDAAEDAAEVT